MGFAPRDRPEHLATKLLAIRKALRLSQSQLVRALNCELSSARISEYEHGVREPSLLVLLRYVRLVNISMNLLADDNLELKFPKNLKKPKQLARHTGARN